MRTKKLFSLLLAVLMLCSLSVSAFAAETAQASVPVVLTVGAASSSAAFRSC